MGDLITNVHWDNIAIPKFDPIRRSEYSQAFRAVLAHPSVGLIPPENIKAIDLLIARQPVFVPADSAFGIVIRMEASKLNPDFTAKWRGLFKGNEKAVLAKISALKAVARPLINELIIRQFFPELYGVKYGVNFWPIQFDGAFIATLGN